jgi:sarcosine oxidase subunit gamma
MSNGKNRIFWLGPNEWLAITPLANSLELMARLRKSFTGQHACVTDVSGGQIAMQLSGLRVRDLLAKGCTLDFHPDRFKAGSCAQSGIAKANMLIGLVDDQASFEIAVRRSYVEYFALWLRHAAREYGVSFSVG